MEDCSTVSAIEWTAIAAKTKSIEEKKRCQHTLPDILTAETDSMPCPSATEYANRPPDRSDCTMAESGLPRTIAELGMMIIGAIPAQAIDINADAINKIFI